MTDEAIYAWAVMTVKAVKGTHWQVFKTRSAARAFRKEHGGRLFRIVEAH